jgi:anti-sigma regulatory factor (Ser/Thr protein kinase)
MKIDKYIIRKRALQLVADGGHRVGAQVASEFDLSRQVANGYMQALIKEGLIEAEGSTRARVYRLQILAEANHAYPREGLQEDLVWRRDFRPLVADLPENVRDIWHYGVTEMVNNAIDHSGSAEVRVTLMRNALFTDVCVADDGEGIFLKIQRALNLFDPREAILELAKGKVTTAPEQHSGEGIFFTSRVMDGFDIHSGRLHFRHYRGTRDVIEERSAEITGTRVSMRLDNESDRTLKSVFDAFADSEEYTFDRTVVPVRLAQHEGEKLVSRSQAKRVAQRFERFKEVVLDFDGVAEIGQAFADELFRVFAGAHPDVRLTPINTSEAVAQMVRRVMSASGTAK